MPTRWRHAASWDRPACRVALGKKEAFIPAACISTSCFRLNPAWWCKAESSPHSVVADISRLSVEHDTRQTGSQHGTDGVCGNRTGGPGVDIAGRADFKVQTLGACGFTPLGPFNHFDPMTDTGRTQRSRIEHTRAGVGFAGVESQTQTGSQRDIDGAAVVGRRKAKLWGLPGQSQSHPGPCISRRCERPRQSPRGCAGACRRRSARKAMCSGANPATWLRSQLGR